MKLIKEKAPPRPMDEIQQHHKSLCALAGMQAYEIRRIEQQLEAARAQQETIMKNLNEVNLEAFDREALDKKIAEEARADMKRMESMEGSTDVVI